MIRPTNALCTAPPSRATTAWAGSRVARPPRPWRNPHSRDHLLAQEPDRFIATMERWARAFVPSEDSPVPGMTREDFARLRMPVLILRGSPRDLYHPARVSEWAGKELRFYDAVKALSLDLAATSFLGVPLGAEADRINKAFVDEVQASIAPIRSPLPGTAMRKGVKARAYLIDLFEREIPARRAGTGEDFFSIFCRAVGDDGQPLGAAAIADHMNFLMMAAHDTITSSATSLIMLLARHQDWQERLREEVASLGLNKDEVPHGKLDQLVLTEYAFKEALRLMPPVPTIPRRALKDFSFGGYDIPAGTFVGVNPAYTHHMAEHWPDPETFDPMRFSPEASRGRHRFAWVPFGGGAHMCIGLHFATMQIRILVAHLLQRYRIEIAPGSGDAWQVFPIPRPRDGLPVTFKPL